MMLNVSKFIDISIPVHSALEKKYPIVALESTIIAHGMPYPQNLKVANEVEDILRSSDVMPATIAILDGKIKIGLTAQELEFVAQEGKNIAKASRRDLPYLLAQKKHGATTVAATMIAAHMAGIQIFATGGIGGVHKGGENSMDISADLQELAKTDVAVVCSGAKAILDLSLTIEYLETYGVPVIGYRTSEFPAFYSRNSGESVNYRLDDVKEIAEFLQTKWALKLRGGVVIANPIPEEHSMKYDEVNEVVNLAIAEAESNNIRGKDISPFLLSKIEELTGGESLRSNIELVYANVRLAASIAKAMSDS